MNLLLTALIVLLIAYVLRRVFGHALNTMLAVMLVLLLIGIIADPVVTRSIVLHIVNNLAAFVDRLRYVFGL